MVDHTRIILVKNELKESTSACKSLKLQSFIMPINSEWCGVIVPNEDDIEKIAQSISKRTKAFTFLHEHVEDYGWYYQLYLEGKQVASLYMNYVEDDDHIDNANLPLLESIALSPSHLEKLDRCLQADYAGDEYYLLNLFREAFQFQDIQYLSYDSIEDLDSAHLEELKIEFLMPFVKTANFADHVVGLFQKPLQQMDFILETELFADSHVRFNRIVNDFLFTVVFDRSEKSRLRVNLLTPYTDNHIYRLLEDAGLALTFSYQNKKELNELLERHGYLFIKRANEFVTENPVVMGDVDKLYEERLHSALKKYGFEQAEFPPNVIKNGGIISYRKEDDVTLLFKHHPGSASIEPIIIYEGKKYFISQIVKYHSQSLNLQLQMGEYVYFSFRNEHEFFQTIDRLIHCIEWILQTGIDRVVI
ncbi:hypothetical protein [Priestia koreensis]|uniref:hypothetical protein n=1 Tax=Priestia koreensis TaxID=284581 RepID=UPI001F56159F|nr:hypothetical protein [Priestia koreensis]UNL86882.1 hypothetical protein IE339_10495 [Priestia koreensis]